MKKVLIVATVLALAGIASANTVTFWIDYTAPSTDWKLRASCSSDNYGLAVFNCNLTGYTTIINDAPAIHGASNFGSAYAGFIVFRSGTGTIPVNPVSAGQDTVGGGYVAKNIGRSAVDLREIDYNGDTTIPDIADTVAFYFPPPGANNWGRKRSLDANAGKVDADVILAVGTCTANSPPTHTGVLEAATFDNNTNKANSNADVVWLPEPATIGLLVLGMFGLLRRR